MKIDVAREMKRAAVTDDGLLIGAVLLRMTLFPQRPVFALINLTSDSRGLTDFPGQERGDSGLSAKLLYISLFTMAVSPGPIALTACGLLKLLGVG